MISTGKTLTKLKKYFPKAKIVKIRLDKSKISEHRYLVDGKYLGKNQVTQLIEEKELEILRKKIWNKAQSYNGEDYRWSLSSNSLYFNLNEKCCRVSDHKQSGDKYFYIDILI